MPASRPRLAWPPRGRVTAERLVPDGPSRCWGLRRLVNDRCLRHRLRPESMASYAKLSSIRIRWKSGIAGRLRDKGCENGRRAEAGAPTCASTIGIPPRRGREVDRRGLHVFSGLGTAGLSGGFPNSNALARCRRMETIYNAAMKQKTALESCRNERRKNQGTIEYVVRQNNEGACSSHPWRSTIFIREQPGDTSLIISEGNLTRGIISANHQTSVPNPWMQWMHTSSGEA